LRKSKRSFIGAGWIVAVLTPLMVVGAAALTRGGIFSPGPLSGVSTNVAIAPSSHADLACSDCHSPFWGAESMADRCLACHVGIQQELLQPGSLHGRLPSADACRECHTEHRGPQASLTRIDAVTFPHDSLGYSLQAHKVLHNGSPFDCESCHEQSLRVFAPATCSQCHLKMEGAAFMLHEVTFGSLCLNCHDGLDTYGGDFDHGKTDFPLVSAHASVECRDCHSDARTIQDLKRSPTRCAGCHEQDDAHSGRLGDDCAECHVTTRWTDVEFDHASLGFALTGAHVELTCSDCHLDGNTRQVPSTCVGCHGPDDPHQGRLGDDCAGCHTVTGWNDVQFDHGVTGFALTLAHGGLGCSACHSPKNASPVPSDCVGCHQLDDAHNGGFGSDCSLCHRPTVWSDWTFDHDLSRFKLTGAHSRVACTSCHVDGQFQGTPTACAACHREPAIHAGLFGTNCAACHSTSAWRPAAFNGPHSFPLNHGGAGAVCSTCHTSGYTSYTCYNCHNKSRIQNHHAEEGIRNISNCVACHPNGREEEGGDD
jgi:hypothetical protein